MHKVSIELEYILPIQLNDLYIHYIDYSLYYIYIISQPSTDKTLYMHIFSICISFIIIHIKYL